MNADLLRRLVDAGTPSDLVAEIAMELARLEVAASPPRSKGAIRQARYREGQRAKGVTGDGDVTPVTLNDAILPLSPPSPKDPQTPKEPQPPHTPTHYAREGRGTVLPAEWTPLPAKPGTIAAKVLEARGEEWQRHTFEKFENFWRAKSGSSGRKRDWQATWCNWVIEDDRREGQGNERRIGTRQHSSGGDRTLAAAASLVNRMGHERG